MALWKEHELKEHLEIKNWLAKAANWGPFDLDARIGLRVTTALDTINRMEEWERLGKEREDREGEKKKDGEKVEE